MAVAEIRPDWTVGTLTLTSGSVNFTTSGSSLQTAAIQAGDEIITQSGLTLIIATITGQNAGTLMQPCPAGAAGAGQPLRIRFQPDGSRYNGATADLVNLLGNGALYSISGLTLDAGDYLRASGPGDVGKMAGKHLDELAGLSLQVGDYLRAGAGGDVDKVAGKNLDMLAGLTAVADRLPFFNSANSMSLTALSSYARTLLGRSNGGQVYGDLGIIPEGQIPERIRDRIPSQQTDCNTITQSGWSYISGATANRPPTGGVGIMLSLFQTPTYGTQIFYDRRDGLSSFRRVCVNGVWSNWRSVSTDGYSQLFSDDGWCCLPNGLYVQWGRPVVTLGSNNAGTITLPTTFPNNHFTQVITNGDWGVAAARPATFVTVSRTNSNIAVGVNGVPANTTLRVNYVAIGN